MLRRGVVCASAVAALMSTNAPLYAQDAAGRLNLNVPIQEAQKPAEPDKAFPRRKSTWVILAIGGAAAAAAHPLDNSAKSTSAGLPP